MMTAGLTALGAAAAVLLVTVLGGVSTAHGRLTDEPVVIGHRGASGHRPEHTMASYRLAIDLGVAAYADGIGPSKTLVVPVDDAGRLGRPTSLVDDAHDAGLVVHPYTFRHEHHYLPEDFRVGDPAHPEYPGATGDAAGEYRLYYRLGVDGVFSDNPDTAVAVRATLFDR